MPPEVTGDWRTDPAGCGSRLAMALGERGYIADLTTGPGPVLVTDSGEDGDGFTLPLITCRKPHGLIDGAAVTLLNCGDAYDGERQAETRGPAGFLILNTPYIADAAGDWA